MHSRDAAADASPQRRLAYFALLLMIVIWGANFSVAKIALGTVPPLAFNALRFPFAALVLFLVLRARGPISLPAPADRARVLVLALLGNVLYQQFFIFGLEYSDAGIASVLLAGTPILTALLSAALGHEHVRPRAWIGVTATFAGIVLVVYSGVGLSAGRGDHAGAGALFMVGASLAWATYTVGARPLIARYGPIPVTAWTLWIGTVFLVVIGAPQALALDPVELPVGIWLAIVYAGALSIGLAYMIWNFGVRVLGNTRTSAYSNLVPVIGLSIAWLWLGEVPSLGELAGSAVIIGGVALAQTGRRPREHTPRATSTGVE